MNSLAKKIISVCVICHVSICLPAQTSFNVLFKNPAQEGIGDICELHDGSIIGVGGFGSTFFGSIPSQRGKIWKVFPSGDTLTRVYSFADTAFNFGYVYEKPSGELIVFGSYIAPPNFITDRILIAELNHNLDIEYYKTIVLRNSTQISLHQVKKYCNNYYMLGAVTLDDGLNRNFILKLNENLDTISSAIYPTPVTPMCSFDDCNFKKGRIYTYLNRAPTTVASDGDMYVYDTNLNFLYSKNYPYKINYATGCVEVLYNSQLTAKWISDSTFIVGCSHDRHCTVTGYHERDIGLSELDTTMTVKPVHFFGTADSINYASFLDGSIDFNSPDSILFAGTRNMIIDFLPHAHSFIMAGMTDRNLNPRYIHYYGGDAYYLTHVMKRARDGGFIIAASRYDYLTQNNEFDVLLLKLNPQGVITTLDEPYKIPHNGFILFPNPADDRLTLDLEAQQGELVIYDLSGRVAIQKHVSEGKNHINISWLSSGTYICEVVTNQKLKLIQRFQKF